MKEELDYQEIRYRLETYPVFKVLRKESAAFMLGFFHDQFKRRHRADIGQTELASSLAAFREIVRMSEGGEVQPREPQAYLDEWANEGFLRKFYPPGVTEACYDLTPDSERGTVAIFGSGGAARSLGAAAWLASRRLGYWGDNDSQGLRILSGFRTSFPGTESILMDEETFDRFPDYRTDAPADEAREPENLRPDEVSLFRRLVCLPSGNRLEQERIPYEFARRRLLDWAGGGAASWFPLPPGSEADILPLCPTAPP